jgi:Sulfotransferase domain
MGARSIQTKLIEFAGHNSVTRPVWRFYRSLRIKQRSPFDNIYHCCTQKTASQWFRGIFADPVFTDYTGLESIPFIDLGLRGTRFERPFPLCSVVTHLYIDYPTYQAIPKPGRYRAFFVMRDPRDAVISWYFSARYSHALLAPIPEMRLALQDMDLHAGLKYIIDRLEEYGSFAAQRSWLDASVDVDVQLFRYEDLARDNREFLHRLLDYLEVPLPAGAFEALYNRHNFARLALGREQGTEDINSHYRKGIVGDWRNHFDDEVTRHFRRVTGDTLERLGYEP